MQVKQFTQAVVLVDTSAVGGSSTGELTAVSDGFTALTGFSQTDVVGCSCLCLAGESESLSFSYNVRAAFAVRSLQCLTCGICI